MRTRNALVIATALVAMSSVARAQRFGDRPRRPYVAGALNVGAVGFVNADIPAGSLLGAYGYASFSRMLVGVQGGGIVSDPARMRYAIATLGYPAAVRRRAQIYPFFGLGGGALPSTRLATSSGVILGAGVGVDRMASKSGHGTMFGVRGGYLYRSGDGYERAVYVALSAGGAMPLRRERPQGSPPVIVANR